MGTLSELLALAQSRAKALDVPYMGALTPQEAAKVLALAPGAKLVDVRTRAELDWVGFIPGSIQIEWSSYPGFERNPHFVVELKRQVDPQSLVLFICRSGVRSDGAARLATEAGYACYNVLEGFEGDKDHLGQRGKLGGWRHAGLPWAQG